MDLVNEPSIQQGNKYQVFLSFSGGEDTQESFSSLLYSSLRKAGISVLKDDISSELSQSPIKASIIVIIIFSDHYASSKRCLEELTKIMEFHRSYHLVVLPIFYGVDPFDVRNQKFSFGRAFQDLVEKISPTEDELSRWTKTLSEAGGICGIVVPNFEARDESEEVKEVVEKVLDMLDKKDLFVADHPVGVDNRVQEVITMFQNYQSEDVVMVGIWGMGGVGKTTIAKAIYNEIGRTFDSRSYLSKIRKAWYQEEGQVRLQNQLLSDICKTTKVKINSIESGKITLRERLCHKRALVVLDDVDKLAQLNALVGSRDWFGPGSAIIITTRNQRLLIEMDCGVYLMKNLNEGESMELFSWHAFKQESPKENFTKFARDIVAYSGGLPLALQVLGSYLFDREVEEWESVLEKLRKFPNNKILKKLKISFDGLSDLLEREIFLDIACFFIGMDRNYVTQILNGCGFFADIGIKTLVERSLVTIDERDKLGMHDLLREMGREIIREESRKLGKRSRLWFHKDARAVLLKHTGTVAIEGLALQLSESKKMQFQTEAFKKMKRLRLLHLDNVELRGDYKYISRELRWLRWRGFPVKCIPRSFYQKKLVAIDLKYSSLTKVWKEPRLLKKLKILNLSHSHWLMETPDFSKLPNIEKLILKDCPSLTTIHHSIGLLDKLHLLNLKDCIGLSNLPKSIYRVRSLKTLLLSGCVNIKKLGEDIEQMESLTTLIAPTIKQVPFALARLKNILHLSVYGHEGLSHHVIPSLSQSWMFPTNNPLPHIPTYVGMPSSVFWDILNSIYVPLTIPSTEPKRQNLLEDGLDTPDSPCLEYLLIQIGKDSQVFHALSDRVSQGLNLTKYNDGCILPSDNYPHWLTFKGEGASVKFIVPSVTGHNHLKGMTICCVYIPSGDLDIKACESRIICLMIINYTKTTTLPFTEDKLKSLEEVEMKEIISNLESDDQVEVKAVFGSGFTVKKTAVYLLYDESFDELMESSTSEVVNLTTEEEEAHESIRPRKAMKI